MGKNASKHDISAKSEEKVGNAPTSNHTSLVVTTKHSSNDLDKDHPIPGVTIDVAEHSPVAENSLLRRRKNTKDTINDITGLTQRQCKAVRDNWKILTGNNPNQFGIQFFMRFFLTYPEYRNFYPDFRSEHCDVSNKELNRQELRALRDTAAMLNIAAAYTESMTAIFNALENQDELACLLDNVTDRHLPRGVLSLHFQDMMSTLLTFIEEKTCHRHMNAVTRDAWTCALRTIITIIEHRYQILQHKKLFRKP